MPIVAGKDCVRHLIAALQRRGYTCIGPTVRDAAVVYDEIRSEQELPIGITDEQEGGTYRLKARGDEARFGFTAGPQSIKQYLFPSSTLLMTARRTSEGFTTQTARDQAPPYAFIGVRACDLNAIAVQDRTFLNGPYVDPTYKARREKAFIAAVNCGQAGRTCFCVSMEAGPMAKTGYDLALTEILEGGRHEFLIEPGSARGEEIVREIPNRSADDNDKTAAQRMID